MQEVMLYAPALVRDNWTIGREVVLTPRARDALVAAYGPLLSTREDPRTPASTLTALTASVPRGTRYAVCVLKPARDFALDASDLNRAVSALTGGAVTVWPGGDYGVIAGLAGEPPSAVVASDAPFRRRLNLNGTGVEIRMDSWLAADTIRRMGFGHVV